MLLLLVMLTQGVGREAASLAFQELTLSVDQLQDKPLIDIYWDDVHSVITWQGLLWVDLPAVQLPPHLDPPQPPHDGRGRLAKQSVVWARVNKSWIKQMYYKRIILLVHKFYHISSPYHIILSSHHSICMTEKRWRADTVLAELSISHWPVITNIQVHKYTNMQIHKYTNIQIYKYTKQWRADRDGRSINQSQTSNHSGLC